MVELPLTTTVSVGVTVTTVVADLGIVRTEELDRFSSCLDVCGEESC
jgi:hypothetical protein